MKNFFLSTLAIIVISAIAQMFLPWWIIAVASYIVAYVIEQKSFTSFLSGFLAIFLLWSVYAFVLSSANENILASKVALLLPLKGNVWLLLLVTGIIGGLVSGFAALSGNLAAKYSEP
jgi:hypothetical protein